MTDIEYKNRKDTEFEQRKIREEREKRKPLQEKIKQEIRDAEVINRARGR